MPLWLNSLSESSGCWTIGESARFGLMTCDRFEAVRPSCFSPSVARTVARLEWPTGFPSSLCPTPLSVGRLNLVSATVGATACYRAGRSSRGAGRAVRRPPCMAIAAGTLWRISIFALRIVVSLHAWRGGVGREGTGRELWYWVDVYGRPATAAQWSLVAVSSLLASPSTVARLYSLLTCLLGVGRAPPTTRRTFNPARLVSVCASCLLFPSFHWRFSPASLCFSPHRSRSDHRIWRERQTRAVCLDTGDSHTTRIQLAGWL